MEASKAEQRGRSRSRQSKEPKGSIPRDKQVQVAHHAVDKTKGKPPGGDHGGDFVIVAHTVTVNINFNI
uniref:Movement protein n=1 Tax=Soybean yellow mottle mosaic virus TaxID=578361 RepID=A0A0R7IKD3_9TOMB|nr:p8 protein [Soybean yellow mottle mosaic virus]QDQ46690.1 Movement protein [Soybean yellow mottle mosaic virus]